jgi:nucleotide-binding universal stress UspA family protein
MTAALRFGVVPVSAPGDGSVLRILNATSASPASQRATVVAAAIASEHGGELFVVHVRPPVELRVVRLGPTSVSARWLDDPYSEPVLLGARRLAWEHAIGARVGLIAGPPADGIVMAARQMGAGLVVVGHASRSTGWRYGVTRTRVKRSSPVPLLTVGRGTMVSLACPGGRMPALPR